MPSFLEIQKMLTSFEGAWIFWLVVMACLTVFGAALAAKTLIQHNLPLSREPTWRSYIGLAMVALAGVAGLLLAASLSQS